MRSNILTFSFFLVLFLLVISLILLLFVQYGSDIDFEDEFITQVIDSGTNSDISSHYVLVEFSQNSKNIDSSFECT
jgi:hypothetical protein